MSRSLDCARDDTGNLSKVPTCFSANIHLSIMLTHSLSRLSNRFNSTNIRRSREQNKFICSAEAPQYMWTQSKHKKNSIIHDIMTDNVISSEAAGGVERSVYWTSNEQQMSRQARHDKLRSSLSSQPKPSLLCHSGWYFSMSSRAKSRDLPYNKISPFAALRRNDSEKIIRE